MRGRMAKKKEKTMLERGIETEYSLEITGPIVWTCNGLQLLLVIHFSVFILICYYTESYYSRADIHLFGRMSCIINSPDGRKFTTYWTICNVLLLVALWYSVRCLAINLVKIVTINYYISVLCGQYQPTMFAQHYTPPK